MRKQVVNIKDGLSKNMKDELAITGPNLRGAVEIYDKDLDGKLSLIRQKHNLIVYGGREWLLRKAFGTQIPGNEAAIYNKEIAWFAAGQGGGEPGNPLQAGATTGGDTTLLSMVRLRSDLVDGVDPGYSQYASDGVSGDHGYYKQISGVVIKEDHANPYVEDSVTKYPPLIAEVRIEVSADDANGLGGVDGWVDLNEAGLFCADPDEADPGLLSSTGGGALGNRDVRQVVDDGDYAIYILDSVELDADVPGVNQGDFLWADRVSGSGNDIDEAAPLLIVDVYAGETGRYAYVVVEKSDIVAEDLFGDGNLGNLEAYLVNKQIDPITMFSRVTFSTIRKTVDREIVFLWKIYF
jgi:hypothetical protein